ncbi:hypothetical protein JET76_23905 [Pseudomonas putida]|uniref:hypothetical protein n=1 Tax=Pseudomonas putida TaxID=303 RepID=UPI0018E6BF61|nr:hypothetical protein [Pseudomonas putida]MBI6944372.1 hypothetical protein [Pseudomonas putida]MBI6960684.1 hypothetical protein [Pseudomonas putida]
MSHPKNTTTPSLAQPTKTVETPFLDTPIDNRGLYLLKTEAGVNAQDALVTAKALSSGAAQLCQHVHDSLNYGEPVYCDALIALKFLNETVSTLVWSVQRGLPDSSAGEKP